MAVGSRKTNRRKASCNSEVHLLSDCPSLKDLPFAPPDVKAKLLAKLERDVSANGKGRRSGKSK